MKLKLIGAALLLALSTPAGAAEKLKTAVDGTFAPHALSLIHI